MNQLPELLLEEILEYLLNEKKIINLTCKYWRSLTTKRKLKYDPDLTLMVIHNYSLSLVRTLSISWNGEFVNILFPNLRVLRLIYYSDCESFHLGDFLSNHLHLKKLEITEDETALAFHLSLINIIPKVLINLKQLVKFHFLHSGESTLDIINSLPNLSLKDLRLEIGTDANMILSVISSRLTQLECLNLKFISFPSNVVPLTLNHKFPNLKYIYLAFRTHFSNSLLPLLTKQNFPSLKAFKLRPGFNREVHCLDINIPEQWLDLTLNIINFNSETLQRLQLLNCKKEIMFTLDSSNQVILLDTALKTLTQITSLNLIIFEDSRIDLKFLRTGFKQLNNLKVLKLSGLFSDDLFSIELNFKLTTLFLEFYQTGETYQHISNYILYLCPTLKELKLDGGLDLNITNLKNISLNNLKIIDLESKICSKEKLLEFVSQLPSLISAQFFSGHFNDNLKLQFPLLYLQPYFKGRLL